ncbi:MAG: hypothetical protein RL417_1344 [Pseudomonadota bacterium]|jgi:hypothetical protein
MSIIENLFAIGLLGITIVGTVNLHIYTLHANGANQHYSALIDEVQAIFDGYRSAGLNSLLGKFEGLRTAIANGATVTESLSSVSSNVSYVVTFTALSSASGSAPQAVQVRIDATQQRGKLGTKVFSYETIIAQTA